MMERLFEALFKFRPLLFAEGGKARSLYLASVAAGLAYLTRPNGLFLMFALWGVLLACEILVLAREQRWSWRQWDRRRLRGIATRFSVAGWVAKRLSCLYACSGLMMNMCALFKPIPEEALDPNWISMCRGLLG